MITWMQSCACKTYGYAAIQPWMNGWVTIFLTCTFFSCIPSMFWLEDCFNKCAWKYTKAMITWIQSCACKICRYWMGVDHDTYVSCIPSMLWKEFCLDKSINNLLSSIAKLLGQWLEGGWCVHPGILGLLTFFATSRPLILHLGMVEMV